MKEQSKTNSRHFLKIAGAAGVAAVPLRQNTQREYDDQQIKTTDFDQVQAMGLEPGVSLHFATQSNDLEMVLECVNQGNLNQYGDKAFVEELIH